MVKARVPPGCTEIEAPLIGRAAARVVVDLLSREEVSESCAFSSMAQQGSNFLASTQVIAATNIIL